MSTSTGAQLLVRMLKAEGVRNIFTLSGLHIAPIYAACVEEGIQLIDTRHEQAAAHAADATARLTRGIGVCAVTAGPGVTDALTGIANAYAANSPVLLLGRAAAGRSGVRRSRGSAAGEGFQAGDRGGQLDLVGRRADAAGGLRRTARRSGLPEWRRARMSAARPPPLLFPYPQGCAGGGPRRPDRGYAARFPPRLRLRHRGVREDRADRQRRRRDRPQPS